MRRALLIIAAFAAVAPFAVQALTVEASSDGSVDAIFDTAKGLVAGQAVKVAGVPVGTVDAVKLQRTPGGGYRARLTLTVNRRFLPFRTDATCRILPQGLLSEHYVACDPGSPTAAPLPARGDGRPTVPVERTAVPASLQDVLDTFDVPTSQRLALLVNGLGAGTAGRGGDIRTILRRAFPALDEADRALALVNAQRDRLRDAVQQSDRILADLGSRDEDIRRFVDRAADVSTTTAQHREALAQAVRRAPALLDQLDATLPSVRRITRASTPLLVDLRRAAPRLESFTRTFGRFSAPAPRALSSLSDAAERGRRALRPGRPVVADLTRLIGRLRPFAPSADRLLRSVRDRGAGEGLFGFFYILSAALGPYDRRSHVLPIAINVNPRCILASIVPGTQVEPGCSHAYSAPGFGKEPQTQLAPSGASASGNRVSRKSVSALLDYLLR